MDEELLKDVQLMQRLCAWLDDIELPEVELSVIDELRSSIPKVRIVKNK